MNSSNKVIIYRCEKCGSTINFSPKEFDIGNYFLSNLISPDRFMVLPTLLCMKCFLPCSVEIVQDVIEETIKTDVLYSSIKLK